jgi:chromosome segregation ATPase
MTATDMQYQHMLQHLSRANEVTSGYRSVFQQYHSLLVTMRRTTKQNESLAKENGDLRVAKRALEDEYLTFKSSVHTSCAQQAKVTDLEAKVAQLGEELQASLKAKGQNDQAFIDIHRENTDLRAKLQLATSELESQLSIKAQLETDKAKLASDLGNTEHRLSLLIEEMRARDSQMKSDQKARQDLQENNNELLQRLMSQKENEAEVVNTLTDINKQQMSKIQG